ncbi:MAG: DUF2130 domain-containing protein, partial [Clostridia bacterium]|nr:DUF2130 domain-containing protein [Clostridia bacterium]
QVKDKEFEREMQAQIALELAKSKEAHQQIVSDKDRKIQDLENRLKLNEKDAQMQLSNAVSEKEKSYETRMKEKNEIIAELKNEIKTLKETKETELRFAVIQAEQTLKESLAKKDVEITKLNGRIENDKQFYASKEEQLNKNHHLELQAKDEQIAYYKDLKARLSTKLLGETLEQHCQIEFNKLRATGFQSAYFEKDNDAKTGSKGDFIFRDYENGVEFISIMFEMKNEADTTATKKKNEDFLKELDKDRTEKGCEYAVLVSMLEADSELYNSGIVDVSYKYPKTYVVRPQFFIPIITILRNAAMNSLQYKTELAQIREQNVDVSNFEATMNDFKEKFGRNYRLASEQFQDAIAEIDKTIDHLEKVKKNLMLSERNLRLANNRAEDLTIKKLTANNPTMAAKFAEVKNAKEEI